MTGAPLLARIDAQRQARDDQGGRLWWEQFLAGATIRQIAQGGVTQVEGVLEERSAVPIEDVEAVIREWAKRA